MHDTDRLLHGLDPARDASPVMTDAEAEALLERITATARPTARRVARRRPLMWVAGVAATAVVAVGAIGLIDGPGQRSAFAATPTPLQLQGPEGTPAASVLRRLARAAERQPAAAGGTTEHFSYETWSLFTRIDGEQVTSEVVPQRYETWQKADGSTEQVVTWDGGQDKGSFPPKNDPQPPAAGGTDEMKHWILSQGDGKSAGAFLNRLNERGLDTVLTPQQVAGVLRALATFEGVEYNGTVEDRSGRSGAAFSVESAFGGLPNKQTVIFDPLTGRLLAHEEMLTKDPGKLNVKIPSVIDYTTHVKSGYTTD